MDSDAVARHVAAVRELSKPGQALAPDAATATTRNPAWWRDGEPTPARDRLHRRLLAHARDAATGGVQGRQALVLAGPPGAGKSTILRELLGGRLGEYLVVDADEFKRELLREATVDGSYESWLLPDVVRARQEAGERFYPLDLAPLVHEESAYLAKELRADAIADGDNIVIDTVLGSEPAAVALGQELDAAGYDVTVVDVEVPFELSAARIRTRWEHDYAAAVGGGDALGGRWVPSGYARDVFHGPDGGSKPEAAARRLATGCPAVRRYRVFRTTADPSGAGWVGPRVVADMSRAAHGASLVDT